jgi:hypothetical protein
MCSICDSGAAQFPDNQLDLPENFMYSPTSPSYHGNTDEDSDNN